MMPVIDHTVTFEDGTTKSGRTKNSHYIELERIRKRPFGSGEVALEDAFRLAWLVVEPNPRPDFDGWIDTVADLDEEEVLKDPS